MLKGLYDFTPISPKTLGFKRNDKLLYLASVERDENWLRVSNGRGQIGLVPINYVDVDREVTGSAVIDFLDESLQVARRTKSKFFTELQDIRRSILNPINDLERRLFEFQDIIDQLKAKGSSFCTQGSYRDTKSRKTAVSIVDGHSSPSYLTFEETDLAPNRKLFQDDTTSKCYGDSIDNNDDHHVQVKSEKRIRSGSKSSTYIQFVNTENDNESQNNNNGHTTNGDSEDWCSNNHNNYNSHSDFDRKSISGNTSITYTCPSIRKSISSTQSCQRVNSSKKNKGQVENSVNMENNKNLCELIDTVRQTCGVSHDLSRKVVQTVLQYVHHVKGDSDRNIELFLNQLETPTELHKSSSFLVGSVDYEKLQLILTELRAQAKDDENWILQDDKGTCRLLEELNIILREADERVVIKALEKDDYQNVHSLALYYQKEHRWPRRQLLIQSFATIANIDLKALSVLVNSILPLELAREMMAAVGVDDKQRLETTGNLLSLLLSTGEKLPVTHSTYLGQDFLNFILDKIESTSATDEDMANMFINVLLAYNLQFGQQDENLTIATLATRQNAKFLTQKTVHLLLWGDDPAGHHQLAGQETKCPNSVLKLVMEMFSCAKIADLFYTNDVKVLIDIVIRSLMDWEPGEKRRTLYLQLIRMIIRNSNFREHSHRRHDLVKIFTLILLEEDPLAIPDQRLVREIFSSSLLTQ